MWHLSRKGINGKHLIGVHDYQDVWSYSRMVMCRYDGLWFMLYEYRIIYAGTCIKICQQYYISYVDLSEYLYLHTSCPLFDFLKIRNILWIQLRTVFAFIFLLNTQAMLSAEKLKSDFPKLNFYSYSFVLSVLISWLWWTHGIWVFHSKYSGIYLG